MNLIEIGSAGEDATAQLLPAEVGVKHTGAIARGVQMVLAVVRYPAPEFTRGKTANRPLFVFYNNHNRTRAYRTCLTPASPIMKTLE